MPVPLIHDTDLYRPHGDPDDHFDLATAFSLAWQGQLDLRAVLIDYAWTTDGYTQVDPDITAVAQMNYVTGLAVPVMVGADREVAFADLIGDPSSPELAAARNVLRIMKESAEPVAVMTVGSCRDIALAGTLEPDTFRDKCAAIYLNAGTPEPHPEHPDLLEFNVGQDPIAFSKVLELPCPIYWLPDFTYPPTAEMVLCGGLFCGEYSTFFQFRLGDLLPRLSPRMQNYFAGMFGWYGETTWLRYLRGPIDQEVIDKHRDIQRHMWCTAAFVYLVGKMVTRGGEIVDRDAAGDAALFEYEPIRVSAAEDGKIDWEHGEDERGRWIFHVRDLDAYEGAMTKALITLLTALP